MTVPAAKQHNARLATGRIVFWNPTRGFGFLRRDVVGDDIFISAKACRHSGINDDDLQVGTRVAFELRPDENGRSPRAIRVRISLGGDGVTRSTKSPGDADRAAMSPTPADLYCWPSFKFKHELRPQERPYDYYEAHPEHRPRPLTRRQLRRRIIREG
jgi:cold shock CspA family protein